MAKKILIGNFLPSHKNTLHVNNFQPSIPKYLLKIHRGVLYKTDTDLAPPSTANIDRSHPDGPLPIMVTFLFLKL